VTTPFAGDPDAEGLAADRLRDIDSVTDAALSRQRMSNCCNWPR
jgi:hypothetical protein